MTEAEQEAIDLLKTLPRESLDRVIASLTADQEVEQVAEIGRRIEEIDSGKVEGISSEQLFAEARAILDGKS